MQKTLVMMAPKQGLPVVIDATEWGEGLVLSGASYLQGVEKESETDLSVSQPQCTQAFVFPLALRKEASDVPVPEFLGTPEKQMATQKYKDHYELADSVKLGGSGRVYSFEHVWTYRRLFSNPGQVFLKAHPADISQQNWTAGNDYPYRPLLLTPAETRKTLKQWRGGVDVESLKEAQDHAHGWYLFLRNTQEGGKTLNLSQVYGTSSGLSKIPYVRDTRRSVGIDGFVLAYGGNKGISIGTSWGNETAAIGLYVPDIHPVAGKICQMPSYVLGRELAPVPFSIPLKALTNKNIKNLIVAGKTMAQSFAANSATRVHPIEFASGVAAGILAPFALAQMSDVHALIKQDASLPNGFYAAFRNAAKAPSSFSQGSARLPVEWTK
jgi:hypothetical protein